jgi:hypothetical protein
MCMSKWKLSSLVEYLNKNDSRDAVMISLSRTPCDLEQTPRRPQTPNFEHSVHDSFRVMDQKVDREGVVDNLG